MQNKNLQKEIVEPAKTMRQMLNTLFLAVEELKKPPTGIEIYSWPRMQNLIGGLRMKEFTILCGATGCLGGDSKIRINRAGKGSEITIRNLYLSLNGIGSNKNMDINIPTYVRSFDGVSVNLHKLKNVFLSGIKETWEFRFDQGKKIRATPSHKFLTERGFVEGNKLKNGDRIAFDVIYPKKSRRIRSTIRDKYYQGIKFHPFATKCNEDRRLVYHRAAFEAGINNLSLKEFLFIIRKNKSESDKLKFIDPKKYHIHHKNHDHFDNDFSNLELMEIADHLKYHGDNKNFNQGTIRWIRFLGYGKIGVESVYDIECEDPHHNFSANGLIVHNSGKTSFLANISANLVIDQIPHFVASVETGDADFLLRVAEVLTDKEINDGTQKTKEYCDELFGSLMPLFESTDLLISKIDNRMSVETLISKLQFAADRGSKVALLDNLNFFLEVTSVDNAIVEMDRVVHEIIMFVKRTEMHVIMVMHPKKTINGRVESEFDIKGSSTAVQEAQNVWLFNRLSEETIRNFGASMYWRELTFAKVRRKGKATGARVYFDGSSPRYVEKDAR